jgi:uncharacterized iron-regulated protein
MLRKKFAKFTCSTWRKKFSFARAAATFAVAFISASASAQLYNGDTGMPADMNDLFALLGPGKVVIVSEQHGLDAHHQNQRDFLVQISGAKFPISVGMEFFTYTDQPKVDAYAAGAISEADFLKQIGWGGTPYSNYRFQVTFPYYRGGQAVALNLPRTISGKVSKTGLDSLSPNEKALLPPQLVLGNQDYFERFEEAMQGHIKDPTVLQNYFTAHCLWDETMAWRAIAHLRAHPDQLLMIVVGDFHAQYEDGLVSRLRDQGIDTVVVSQVTDKSEVAPHAKYGRRGNFVWLSEAKAFVKPPLRVLSL